MAQNVSSPLGVAHRRDLLDSVGYFDESIDILEDWDLWKRFARAGAQFVYVPSKSGLYHLRPDSLSSTGRIRSRERPENRSAAPPADGGYPRQLIDLFWGGVTRVSPSPK
jgi:GT2 family glycosyltransferase